jgi:hypothetical protein
LNFSLYLKEARLRDAAEQFCNWLHDLGGETKDDIDPAVVRNLFSTAYDTKPALSAPIKIVEMTRVNIILIFLFLIFFFLSQIPQELREGAQDTMIAEPEQRKATLPELVFFFRNKLKSLLLSFFSLEFKFQYSKI